MIKKIVYCTTSRYSACVANSIQVKQMINAFTNMGIIVYAIFKEDQNVDTKHNFFFIRTSSSRIAHYLYLIKASLLTLSLAKKNDCDVIYTRSISVAFLCSLISKKRIYVELHSSFSNKIEEFLARYVSFFGVEFFCITKALVNYIHSHVPNSTCHVTPDAHSSLIESPRNLTSYYSKWSNQYKPKVGYFGLMKPQKGEKIIKEMLESCSYASFYIYTLNKFQHNSLNLVETCSLSHADSIEKMKEMDFLLLPIEPQGDSRDISSFTSPLKLFEYLATGKVIIASDIPALREAVDESSVVFSKNTSADFCDKVQLLSKDSEKRRAISTSAIDFAKKSTWSARATKIINIIESGQ